MQYMDWYNRSRPHLSLDKKTPDESLYRDAAAIKIAA